ncbi:MAG: penicillin acylase family protein [Bacteriovoracaceae bacterium]
MFVLLSAILWASVSFAQDYPCHATYAELDVVKQEVQSTDEFFYCFGFHHGRDRAWVMDYLRRSALGKNAEVLGFVHLKADLMMRLLDLEGHAEKLWKAWPSEKRKALETYSRGVNEGFKTGKNAREFQDMNYSPEEWKPIHTLAVLLLQSFDQTRKTFTTDWEQEKMKARWKDRAASLMDNDHAPWENTILKAGEYLPAKKKVVFAPSQKNFVPKLWENFPEVFGKESGSNNWAVSAKKSKTGKAILANDPHLDLKTPLFWYWIHLKTPEHEVIGGSLPGIPLIATGTNGKVAWGLTNAYINTADAAFVKDMPESEIENIRPLVWFKFGPLKIPFFFKSFERTKNGNPVLPLELERKDRIFLRWTGFSLTPEDIIPMFELPLVKNVTEADELLKRLGLPSWNFVFADTKGDIGYRLVGNAYKAEGPTPYGIRELTREDLQNKNYFSPEERPHVLKPKRDYVYSANNRHWPEDALFNGGRGYSFSFRGNRIDELLQEKQDVESFKRIQCDHQAVDAKYFVPKLQSIIKIPELKGWNFVADENLVKPSIYRRFMDLLMQKWDVNEYGLWRLLDSPDESMRSEMHFTYQEALKSVGGRKWGELHRLAFAHLSKNTDWIFAPEIGASGDNHTVDPGTAKWNEDRKLYDHSSGASMRMIIEMEERPKIHLVLPGFNRDYTMKIEKNPWEDWKQCRYTTISF